MTQECAVGEDTGALLKQLGDGTREYKATHEEHFLRSWLRNGTEGKAAKVEEMGKMIKEEEIYSGRRVVAKGKGSRWTAT